MMNTAAAALAIVLACTTTVTLGAEVRRPIDPDRSFGLRAGESARSDDGTVVVGFDGVDNDSRCPKGAQCIWAGDATARVWVQRGSGPRSMLQLRTAPGPQQAARALGQEVTLVRLEPVPTVGKTIAAAEYGATLVWRPAPADEAER